MQEEKREERIVAKSKPTFNLVSCCEKFFDCAKSNCVEKSWILKAPCQNVWTSIGWAWSKRIQSRRSVEFSSVAKRCNFQREYEETRSGRRRTGNSWFSLKIHTVRGDSSLQETQTPKAKTKFGHTISMYLQTAYRTWRRFSRLQDKDMVSVRETKWKTSMWTQLSGVFSCPSLSKLRFILGQTVRRICAPPGVTRKLITYQTEITGITSIIVSNSGGERRPCRLTRLFNLQPQKPTSFLTYRCVWEASVENQSKHGKVRSNGSWNHVN